MIDQEVQMKEVLPAITAAKMSTISDEGQSSEYYQGQEFNDINFNIVVTFHMPS